LEYATAAFVVLPISSSTYPSTFAVRYMLEKVVSISTKPMRLTVTNVDSQKGDLLLQLSPLLVLFEK
jgi:hypothetical protein